MWNLLIPAATSLLGGLFGNNSAKKASEAQVKGMQQAAGSINDFYNQGKGYLDPYWNTGIIANSQISKLLGGDYSGFQNSPDYQSALAGGADMLDRSAASRGMLFSGAHQKDLSNFGQQMANQYLNSYRNFLTGVSGAGQNAGSNIGQLGAAAGSNLANLYTGMGNARASSYAAQGQNNANMIGGIGGLLGGLFGNR